MCRPSDAGSGISARLGANWLSTIVALYPEPAAVSDSAESVGPVVPAVTGGGKEWRVLRRDNDILVTTPWQAPNPIRWGAVFAGAVIAAGVMILFTSLWLALAFTTRAAPVANNLGTFLAATAAGAMLLAGLLAGLFASVRGPGAGFL